MDVVGEDVLDRSGTGVVGDNEWFGELWDE